MAAALSPVAGEWSKYVHRVKAVKRSSGDRTQSSKIQPASGVIHGLMVRAGNKARPDPMNNSGDPIRG